MKAEELKTEIELRTFKWDTERDRKQAQEIDDLAYNQGQLAERERCLELLRLFAFGKDTAQGIDSYYQFDLDDWKELTQKLKNDGDGK